MNANWPDIPGYEILSEIGRGGMGVVYRVRHHATGRIFALKMLLGNRGASFVELARFRIEVEALACLNHPNIIKVRDIGLYAGIPYFALDVAERGSLKQAITGGLGTPHQAAELVRILAGAVQHAHERGMLHRDLKPANVLLMEDGTPVVSDFGLVKFASPLREVSEMHCTVAAPAEFDMLLANYARELDAQYSPVASSTSLCENDLPRMYWEQCAARTGVLGDGTKLQSVREFLTQAQEQDEQSAANSWASRLAHQLRHQAHEQFRQPAANLDGLTQAGAIMGSPNYMAPEQATGDHAQIGPRTDVYALGGILYAMLTGQPPFRSGGLHDLLQQACSEQPIPPRHLSPSVSVDIEAICLRCLEKQADARYQSASALAQDLTRFLDGYSPRAVVEYRENQPAQLAPSGAAPVTLTQDTQTPQQAPRTTMTWWPFGRSRSNTGE